MSDKMMQMPLRVISELGAMVVVEDRTDSTKSLVGDLPDIEFYVLARKALDAMERRGWTNHFHISHEGFPDGRTEYPTVPECWAAMVAMDEELTAKERGTK